MDYVAFCEKIIKCLVVQSDMVTVKEFQSDDAKKIVLEVLVSSNDLPRLIGKGGHTINAVKTLLKTASSLHDRKYIELNVEGF